MGLAILILFFLSSSVKCDFLKLFDVLKPSDPSIYKPFINEEETPKSKSFGSFDFVIIGASPAGTVLANRLSEIQNWTVLLIEAGKFGGILTATPGVTFSAFYTNYNWGYETVPQKHVCLGMVDRKCPYPRGRGVGGTSLINGLVYARGNPKDFDRWEKLGNPGWSYKEVLPYFKKSEKLVKNDHGAVVDDAYHGSGGNVNVEYFVPRAEQINTFLRMNLDLGYNLTDCNGASQFGVTPAQLSIKNYLRFDAGTAFIEPVKFRKNLRILTKSYVTKVLIDSDTKEAVGVYFTNKGTTYFVKANKEVIISAGTIASAQILLQSGIGPKQHLNDVGIPVLQHLEVGSTLRDHINLAMTFAIDSYPSLKVLRVFKLLVQNVLGLSAANAIGFYQTKLEKVPDYPDLELFSTLGWSALPFTGLSLNFRKDTSDAMQGNIGNRFSFNVMVVPVHTQSFGTVRLRKNNPFEYPLIDVNALSDPENHDIDTMYEGIQLVLKFLNTSTLRELNGKLGTAPLPACQNFKFLSKNYWYCAIRQISYTEFHPVGTCPMGPDPQKGAVVDAKAKVHGVGKLRVADASVFPFTLTGHPMAPCFMIGEKVSDLIKQEYLGGL